MAKSTAVAVKDLSTTALAVSTIENIDESEIAGLESLGYSEKAEDNLVPIMSLLQDQSAEVKRNHPRQMEGALAGNFLIRSLKKLINVAGTEDARPLPVIPCGFQHMWVQWRGEPGEGQVITQYPFDDRPAEAEEKPDPQNEDRTIWYMPNGDRLVDTRYWYCLAHIDGNWGQVVIPMAGTQHTVSRTWNNLQRALRLPNGAKAPAWFRMYSIGSQFNQRGSQSWYTYDIRDMGWVADRELRDEGRKINESLTAGDIRPDTAAESGAAVSDEDAPV